MTLAQRFLEITRSKGVVGTLRYGGFWLSEKFHERRLGIRTAGFISLADLGFRQEHYSYEPISYGSIFQALDALQIRPDTDVFIDYGCGMGRALFVAATYPFKRVIGVELSADLAEIARRNATLTASKRQCEQIEVITADATVYDPADDISVVLLNNPFSIDLVHQVIDKLLASRKRNPRALTVLFRFPNWASDPLEGHPAFRLRAEQRSYSEVGERLRIYDAVPPV